MCIRDRYFKLRPATKSIKTASGAPRPKSAPRGSKSTTFAQGKFQVSNPQKLVANPIVGTLRFTISISDILMAPSCSLRSFLEVGVSWAASRYSFRNLRFKHRGLQLGMWWYTSRINPHPQPPYQASAWSYGKVSMNRWFILARNRTVSVTHCSIQLGIIRFLRIILDFTLEL